MGAQVGVGELIRGKDLDRSRKRARVGGIDEKHQARTVPGDHAQEVFRSGAAIDAYDVRCGGQLVDEKRSRGIVAVPSAAHAEHNHRRPPESREFLLPVWS